MVFMRKLYHSSGNLCMTHLLKKFIKMLSTPQKENIGKKKGIIFLYVVREREMDPRATRSEYTQARG